MKGRSSLRRPDHPLAGKSGRVRRARLVLWDVLDGKGAPCHWCSRPLVWRVAKGGGDTLVADHLDGDFTNDDPANLVPSCRSCNGMRERWVQARSCVICGESFRPRRPETRCCSQSCGNRLTWVTRRKQSAA